MITILEGPDGGGKTTLATALYDHERKVRPRRAPYTTAHGPYLGEEKIADYYLQELILAATTNTTTIADRSWISEGIYGPIMRQSNRLSVGERRVLERIALGAGAVCVLCLPSFESCCQAYLRRKELEYLNDEHQLREVHRRYEQLNPGIHFIRFNYDVHFNAKTFVAYVEEIHATIPRNQGPGIGEYKESNTLIIGERLNINTACADFPFASWDPASCCPWLAEQLESWEVPEKGLYWINAMDTHGREVYGGQWLEELRPRKVITLGTIALGWFSRHRNEIPSDTNVFTVPHPAYHKRFHHNEPYVLMEAFK